MKTSQTFLALTILISASIATAFTIPADQKAPFADKYWILESSVVSPAIDLNMDGKADTDIRVMLEDCEKDDAEMYKTGGTVMKHEGASKCDEEEETVTESGNWKYNAGTKQLTVKHHDTDKPQTMTVKEVSGNKMVVTTTFTSGKGKHNVTAVYKLK
ncbi:lipocalin family protein [Pseudoflavitalea rhizosphaerae]|uniref:lipocalin family protein n=1 Tax=Pseudoflavitalea rhizosphaerae TaxID=1884793 RepID=UPI000F8C6DDA|nr:lipocalin family protein [Pseudoflavitalea rhizosphaerae]